MAFSLPKLSTNIGRPSRIAGKRKSAPFKHSCNIVIYQGLRDDDAGRSTNDMVETNMAILRRRTNELRRKESLVVNLPLGCCRKKYHTQSKRLEGVASVMEMIVVASSAVGFVFLTGSLCIVLVSLVVAWMD